MTSTTPRETDPREMRRILASSFIGSAVEYYDFLVYSTAAAIVFGTVFFDGLPPEVATFAALLTLAAGYLSRPLGAVIFGHFGDKVGRKGVLVISMVGMGGATVLIGLIPSASVIGIAAPILLVTLRVLQGFALGGEWGGAMLIALEHAPGGRRGFAASFANLGAPAGAILATLALSAFTLLPEDQFLSWGWRVPFLLSIVLVSVGMFIRLKVGESPLFLQLEEEAEKRKVPIVEVLTRHPRQLLLGIVVAISMFTISGIATVWGVSFAVHHGADSTSVLNSKALAAVVLFLTTIFSARLSDRMGRKPVMAIGIAAAAVFAFPMVFLVQSGSAVNFAIAVMVMQGIQGIILGPLAAFLAELFATRIRYTGASLAYQGAAVLGAGFTPGIAAALVLTGGVSLLAGAWIAVLLICLVTVVLAKESSRSDLTKVE